MEKILVVEDDSFFREVFSDLLNEEGYEVDVAASGEEAIEKLRGRDYQVVVTDLVMQGINGLDLLSIVKQKDPAIEVIMVTGHANIDTAIFALKNGARDYLVKPINHDELKHAVGLCVEQRRLLDENQGLKSQIKLFQISQNIANCLDLDRLNSLVIDAILKEVGALRGLIYCVDGIDSLVLKEVRGLTEVVGSNIGKAVLANTKIFEDTAERCIFLESLPPFEGSTSGDDVRDLRQAMLLAIRSKSHLHGCLVLFNDPEKDLQTHVNHASLNFLLDQSQLAFENASRYHTARNLLYIDELTGLFNYRYLELALDRDIKRAERYGSSLSVIFLDLDDFKKVNDVHGHLVGSKVLRDTGALLKKSVREVDTVIRYGGDEYTVILIETGLHDAATVAERIRRNLSNHKFLAEEGLNIRITASIGFACYPEDTKSKVELLEFADQAMYSGKASGKNIVFSKTNLNST
jgi:diguanylate cyclase (GGDEF)-like protein